jgi:hypothetical protein
MTILLVIAIALGLIFIPRITAFLIIGFGFGWGWAVLAFVFVVLWMLFLTILGYRA